MTRQEMLDFCTAISANTDVDLLVSTAADLAAEDVVLGTVPLTLFQARHGSVESLFKHARERKGEPKVGAMINAFATMLHGDSGIKNRHAIYSAAAEVAEDLNDQESLVTLQAEQERYRREMERDQKRQGSRAQ